MMQAQQTVLAKDTKLAKIRFCSGKCRKYMLRKNELLMNGKRLGYNRGINRDL
jgi:hypothetical protein